MVEPARTVIYKNWYTPHSIPPFLKTAQGFPNFTIATLPAAPPLVSPRGPPAPTLKATNLQIWLFDYFLSVM